MFDSINHGCFKEITFSRESVILITVLNKFGYQTLKQKGGAFPRGTFSSLDPLYHSSVLCAEQEKSRGEEERSHLDPGMRNYLNLLLCGS